MNLFDVLFAKKLSGGGSPFPPVIKRVTGNPVEFTDGADAPLVKCVTQITGYQQGSGTPSPDNIRPITAYTENTISVGGNEYSGADNLTVFNSGTSIVVQANNKRLVSKGVPVNNNDLVLIKYDNTQFKLASMFYYDNPTITVGAIANNQTINLENTSGEYKFTATNGGYVYFYFVPNIDRNVSPSELSDSIVCVMKTTTHTTYPSAIYRGSEDVVGGVLTTHPAVQANMIKITLTLSDSVIRNNDHSFYINPTIAGKNSGNIISSKLPSAQISASDCIFMNQYGAIRFNTTDAYSTPEAFVQHFFPMDIAYEVNDITPTQITPTNLPIKSLSGYNHIESSTGEMTIDYITDAYQNFVDTTERAIPSTRKGGVKAFDIFKTLDEPKKPEASAEESEPEEKEIEEGAKK